MTHGESLAMTVEATQRALHERLDEAVLAHRDRWAARDDYAATDTFLASASRHLAAAEAILVSQARHTGPNGGRLGRDYLAAARDLEHALVRIKGRLYGQAYLVHLAWPPLWADARKRLDDHDRLENDLVEHLVRFGDPTAVDALARRMFDVEAHGPTRPHPRTPHTGVPGRVARRMWALADRFWDAAEGRVIPEPVRPRARRHDSLIGQYLVADPRFDASASVVAHRCT